MNEINEGGCVKSGLNNKPTTSPIGTPVGQGGKNCICKIKTPLEEAEDRDILNKLDIIIKLLEMNNHLMYLALGGEEKEEMIECPSCKNNIKPDGLGYCPKCRADLKAYGLISDEKGD